MALPEWQLDILERAYPALQAEELLALVSAVSFPYMEQGNQKRLMSQLKRALMVSRPAREPFVEYDPEKAGEYFRAAGIKVIDG